MNTRLNKLIAITKFLNSLDAEEIKFVQYAVNGKMAEAPKAKSHHKKHHCDKITDKKVRKVIDLKAQGVSYKEASKISGVKYGTINTPYFKKRVEALLEKIPADNKMRTY